MVNLKDMFNSIIVNGRTKPISKKCKSIDYSNIIILAFGSYEENPNRAFTIVYTKGVNDKSGSVAQHENVEIEPGMIFNVTATDKS